MGVARQPEEHVATVSEFLTVGTSLDARGKAHGQKFADCGYAAWRMEFIANLSKPF
jgi:hypothetical protein